MLMLCAVSVGETTVCRYAYVLYIAVYMCKTEKRTSPMRQKSNANKSTAHQ